MELSPSTSTLAEKLSGLTEAEQERITQMLNRGARDREQNGDLSEVSLVTNALKTHATDSNAGFQNIQSKKAPAFTKSYPQAEKVQLPEPTLDLESALPADKAAFERIMRARASRRDYSGEPISAAELAALLHYGYGVRGDIAAYNHRSMPLRTAPTAGGLQSPELYVAVNAVEGIEQGIYHFDPVANALELIDLGNVRWRLVEMCRNYAWIAQSSVVVFVSSVITRLEWKYGRRAYRMAHLDCGIVAQNLHLSATRLALPSCLVMGFDDDEINDALRLDGRSEAVNMLVTVGRPAPQTTR
jgi:SagB-type dehydrogenase family enzyme